MKPEQFSKRQIKTALVTGACSGIGLSFARTLAQAGVEVVMVSNNENRLCEAAAQLRLHSATVYDVCMDLATQESARRLFDYCHEEGLEIDLLVNNAGMFFFRDVCDTSPEALQTMMNLHVSTPMQLCRLFGEEMGRRGRGYILNISSMAAWMPFPGITMYSATKVFVRDFSMAFYEELHDRGVHLTVVCPGAIDTALFGLSLKLRRLGRRLGILMSPDRLAVKSLRALLAGRRRIIPGAINTPFVWMARALPWWLVRVIRRQLKRWMK